MNRLPGFVLFLVIVGFAMLLYASPEIDWSRDRVANKQTISISPDGASTCDNAVLVKDGSCNLQVEGVAYVGDPGTLIYTNTDAKDDCDTAAAVGTGKCNAKATALTWEYTVIKFVSVCVVLGAIVLGVFAIVLRPQ